MRRRLMAATAIVLALSANVRPMTAFSGLSVICFTLPAECRLMVAQPGRTDQIQRPCEQSSPSNRIPTGSNDWRIWVTAGLPVSLMLDCDDEERLVVVRDGLGVLAEGRSGESLWFTPRLSGPIEIHVIR